MRRFIQGKSLSASLVFLVIFLFLAFSSLGTPAHAQKKTYLHLATSSMGGTWFPLGSGICALINTKVPGATAAPTLGGGAVNIKNIEKQDVHLAFTLSPTAHEAWEGQEWAKGVKYQRQRGVLTLYISPNQYVVPKDSKIQSFKDLVGKNLCPGKAGWATEIFTQRILKFFNITYDDIKKAGGKVVLAGYTEMTMGMKDKHLDCTAWMVPAPSSGIMDIATAFPVRLLPYPDDLLKYLEDNYNTTKMVVPAKVYNGVDKPVPHMGIGHFMIADKDLPEDLIYEITKAVWENIKSLEAVHPVVKAHMKLANAVSGISVPLHKGAAKYYKEKGVAIPARIAPID
jgi:TRAP transporter TAXI family solute receptor